MGNTPAAARTRLNVWTFISGRCMGDYLHERLESPAPWRGGKPFLGTTESAPALLAFTSQEGDAAAGTALMSEALRSESAALVGPALQAANAKARLAAM